MSWQVLIDYGTGWVDLSAYGGADLVRFPLTTTEKLYDTDFKPALGSVKFSVSLEPTLASSLIACTDDIPCIINKDAAVWFTGFARPVTKFTVSEDEIIDFEVFDYGYILERSLQTDFVISGDKIFDPSDVSNSIIHNLLDLAGFPLASVSAASSITTVISRLTLKSGTSFSDAIAGILFDYHHTYTISFGGVFSIYDWAPAAITTGSTIAESDIIKEIALERKDDDQDQVRVIYDRYELIENYTLVHEKTPKPANAFEKMAGLVRDGESATGGLDSYGEKTWPPTTTEFLYKLPESENSNAEVLAVDDPVLATWGYRFYDDSKLFGLIDFTNYKETTGRDGADWELTTEIYGAKSATLQWTVKRASLKEITLRGDAHIVFKGENQTSIYSTTGSTGRLKEYTATYIYEATAAQALAVALVSDMEHGKLHFSFDSETEYALGGYCELSSPSMNLIVDVRIVARQWDQKTDIWSYDAVSVGPAMAVAGSVITGGFYLPPNSDELSSVIERVNAGLDSDGSIVQPIQGNSIAAFTPTVPGLYMTADKLGYFDGSVWRSVINENGTFKFSTASGDFIEWLAEGNLEIQGSVKSYNFAAGLTGWRIDRDGNAEFNGVVIRGTVEAEEGDIGGWEIGSTYLRDNGDQVVLNSSAKRIEIKDSGGTLKTAFGYLNGIGSYTSTDFGLYVAPGNKVSFASGGSLDGDDYTVSSDGALVIDDGEGGELARFGSLPGGGVGFVVGDPDDGAGIKYTLADGLEISGGLQALFGDFSETLTIGYEGTGTLASPDEGDRRIYIDGDEIGFRQYTNGVWTTVNSIQIGGSYPWGNFAPFIGCRGVYNPLGGLPDGDLVPNNNFKVFDFEGGTIEDQNGIAPDIYGNSPSTTTAWSKFGSYSLTADLHSIGTIGYTITEGLVNRGGISGYVNVTGYNSVYGGQLRILFVGEDASSDFISADIRTNATGGLRFVVNNISTTLTQDVTPTDLTDVFIAIEVDLDTEIASFLIDDQIHTIDFSSLGGLSEDLSETRFYANTANFDGSDPFGAHIWFIDDLCFGLTEAAVIDFFLQHYLSGEPWASSYTAEDIILKPGNTGRIVNGDGEELATKMDAGVVFWDEYTNFQPKQIVNERGVLFVCIHNLIGGVPNTGINPFDDKDGYFQIYKEGFFPETIDLYVGDEFTENPATEYIFHTIKGTLASGTTYPFYGEGPRRLVAKNTWGTLFTWTSIFAETLDINVYFTSLNGVTLYGGYSTPMTYTRIYLNGVQVATWTNNSSARSYTVTGVALGDVIEIRGYETQDCSAWSGIGSSQLRMGESLNIKLGEFYDYASPEITGLTGVSR